MLKKIKVLLGLTADNSKDDLLTILIEQAIEEALTYTHQDCVDGLDTAIIKMVVYKYNRIGTEGVDSEGYSGVSFNFATDYPDSIIRILKSKRKLIAV